MQVRLDCICLYYKSQDGNVSVFLWFNTPAEDHLARQQISKYIKYGFAWVLSPNWCLACEEGHLGEKILPELVSGAWGLAVGWTLYQYPMLWIVYISALSSKDLHIDVSNEKAGERIHWER